MLQKSKSASIAKAKFLVLLPVMFCMLTFVSFAQESGNEVEQESQESVTTIQVSDVENQTEAEKARVMTAVKGLTDGKTDTKLVITDGESSIIYKPEYEGVVRKLTKTEKLVDNAEVPFALIEQVPIFPGCEGLSTNDERKKCMADKITAHVNTNFNAAVVDKNKLSGLQKIFVQFKIDGAGEVHVLGVKAPDPALEAEARRVVEIMPQMIPGKQRGKAVSVIYSLPIQFMIAAESSSEGQ